MENTDQIWNPWLNKAEQSTRSQLATNHMDRMDPILQAVCGFDSGDGGAQVSEIEIALFDDLDSLFVHSTCVHSVVEPGAKKTQIQSPEETQSLLASLRKHLNLGSPNVRPTSIRETLQKMAEHAREDLEVGNTLKWIEALAQGDRETCSAIVQEILSGATA